MTIDTYMTKFSQGKIACGDIVLITTKTGEILKARFVEGGMHLFVDMDCSAWIPNRTLLSVKRLYKQYQFNIDKYNPYF